MSPLLDQMSNYSTVIAHGQAWLRGQKTDPPCQSLRYRNAINKKKKPERYLIRCSLCIESKKQRKEKRVNLACDGRKVRISQVKSSLSKGAYRQRGMESWRNKGLCVSLLGLASPKLLLVAMALPALQLWEVSLQKGWCLCRKECRRASSTPQQT